MGKLPCIALVSPSADPVGLMFLYFSLLGHVSLFHLLSMFMYYSHGVRVFGFCSCSFKGEFLENTRVVKYLFHYEKEKSFILTYCSVAKSCPVLCDPLDCTRRASLVLHCLSEFAQTHVCWVGDVIQPSHPLSPPCLAFNLSSITVFSKESVLRIRCPEYWSFSFSMSPSNEYSRLISFRIDWSDLFAVQGTIKSLLQPHSLKASVLRCSAFFMVQLYICTWLLEKP